MRSRMIVIAGPPGGGKSSIFPVSNFGTAYFNADDRAAELNGVTWASVTYEQEECGLSRRQAFHRRLESRYINWLSWRWASAFSTTSISKELSSRRGG